MKFNIFNFEDRINCAKLLLRYHYWENGVLWLLHTSVDRTNPLSHIIKMGYYLLINEKEDQE